MKIISRYKDYYDYIVHLYGIDNKAILKRKLTDYGFKYDDIMESKPFYYPHNEYMEKYKSYQFYWLLICGRQFLLYRENSSSPLTVITEDDPIVKLLPIKTKSRFYSKDIKYFMGAYNESNLKLNMHFKSPILFVHGQNYTTDSPILGDIKNFVSLYPAQEIYRDIEYFLLNQINESADIKPPIELEDKYKIMYHGYDKKSFRPKMRA